MVKQGPCNHCGVTSTPLWRNGPPEKPVLCNACGSRWRTKGTLINYAPLHARAEPDDFVEYKIPKVKFISIKNKEAKLVRRKQSHEHFVMLRKAPNHDQNYPRSLEDDTSNRSSSGSAISYSESCAWYGGTDASELTGSAQSVVWDAQVPSRKRTCVSHPKTSSVEKLTKDLYSILHEQQSSYFSGYSEEDLIFDGEDPMVSVEIGHGSILMKHPSSISREEESEASSCTVDSKSNTVNEVYSGSKSVPVQMDSNQVDILNAGLDAVKKTVEQGTQQEQKKGDKSHELFQALQNPNSPLRSIDLKDVVSFENFVNHFTHDEQLQLMKYLPSVDAIELPKSLKSMFGSHPFVKHLSSFQKIVAEGSLDLSSSAIDAEFEDVKYKQKTGGKEIAIVSKMSHVKRPRDVQNHQVQQAMMRGPKSVVNSNDVTDHEEYCFSPRNLFSSLLDKSSLMLDYMQFNDDGYNQDLLLDVPSNGSFPQAELLYPTSSFGYQQERASSSTVYPHLY